MSKSCNLVINGRSIKANVGETLVDAGLGGWMVIPHDCCSGQCDTCRVTVVRGSVDDQGSAEGRTVLACQATVIGDAEIEFEEIPSTMKRRGVVSGISHLSPDVLEVSVELQTPFDYRPGQYVSVKFAGFPARDFSPTIRLDGMKRSGELVFHIGRIPGGLVSSQIGATIREGHRAQLRGPFGHAFLRDGAGPLVLVSGGTGWAPIWSLAYAARMTQRHRDLVVIAGARALHDLYMRPALDWLRQDGVAEVIGTSELDAVWPVRPGRPTHYLPSLGIEDTVHVAGPSGLVDAVKRKALATGSRCYADPFLPATRSLSLIDRVMRMLQSPAPEAKPSSARSPALSSVLRPMHDDRVAGSPGVAAAAPVLSPQRRHTSAGS